MYIKKIWKDMNSFLVVIYADLLFPFLCLYLFPYVRMRAEKIYSETFDYAMAENIVILVFFAFGICLAVLADLVLRHVKCRKDVWLSTSGIVIILIWNWAGDAGYLNYRSLPLYNRPFCTVYTGCIVYLIIGGLRRKKQICVLQTK